MRGKSASHVLSKVNAEMKKAPDREVRGFDNYRYLRRFARPKHILQVVTPRKNLLKYLPSFEGLTFLWANETALCGKV